NLAPGQEAAGIDFQIQLVPFATITGIVAGADDVVAVMLVPQDASGSGLPGGQMLTGRSQADGTFSISNVPPGRYVAIARSGGRAQKNGAFEVGNLLPGRHYIRVMTNGGGGAGGQGQAQAQAPGQARGQAQVQTPAQWTLKSVLVAGQDVTDQPVDLKPGQNV